MTTSIEDALRSGAVRLVPVEADEMAIEVMREAFRHTRRGGVCGMTIDAQWRSENAPELAAYAAMLSASPDHTAALVALIEERDRLKVERDEARERLDPTAYAIELGRKLATLNTRAEAAEAKCDALREALAAEREACAWVAREIASICNMLQNDNIEPAENIIRREVAFRIEKAIRARALT